MTELPDPRLRRKLERQVASLAAAILAGREPLVASTQRMLQFLTHLRLADADPERIDFVRISSETDHLPLGSERRHWNAEALRRKDVEISQAEAWARTFGLESCRHLIERFGPSDDEP
jgi:hypothetical protein